MATYNNKNIASFWSSPEKLVRELLKELEWPETLSAQQKENAIKKVVQDVSKPGAKSESLKGAILASIREQFDPQDLSIKTNFSEWTPEIHFVADTQLKFSKSAYSHEDDLTSHPIFTAAKLTK